MLLFTAETPTITSPLIQTVIEIQTPQVVEPEPIYTIEDKIAMNYYGCDESIEYIRADDATCLPKPVRRVNNQVSTQNTPYTIKNGSQSNLYAKCNCTFYAKERRPDLPNNLGNANTWFTRASAQGFSVGYEPRVGAIGEATTGYMHVVYVESVDGDMVTISEWNFNGPCVLTYRTVHKSSFRYIY